MINSILAKDKVELKRLTNSILRIKNSGVLLVGVDTKNLANKFIDYFTKEYHLLFLPATEKLLEYIAYNSKINKTDFLITDIFNSPNPQEIINNLQFQRDFIFESDIKLVIVLSNEMLEYLKVDAGDFFSTVKFAYSFKDHSYSFDFSLESQSLSKAIQNYEQYINSEKVIHNNIAKELAYKVALEAYETSDFSLALKYFKQALQYIKLQNDKSMIYQNIGLVYNYLGEYKEALKFQNKALKIYTKQKNDLKIAQILDSKGLVYTNLSKYSVALELFEKSIKIKKRDHDEKGLAITYSNIGDVNKYLGQLDVALKYYHQSLDIEEKLNNIEGKAISLNTIAITYEYKGDLEKALKYYKIALNLHKSINNIQGIASILGNIGTLYIKLSHYDVAFNYIDESLKLNYKTQNKREIIISYQSLSLLYYETKDLEKALKYVNKGLKLASELGDIIIKSNLLNNKGAILHTLKNPKKALEYFKEALKLKQSVGEQKGIAFALENIASIYSEKEDKEYLQIALKQYNEALQIVNDIGNAEGIVNILINISDINVRLKQYNEAIEKYDKAFQLAKKNDFIDEQANILYKKGELYIDINQTDNARKFFLLSRNLYEAMDKKEEIGQINKIIKLLNSNTVEKKVKTNTGSFIGMLDGTIGDESYKNMKKSYSENIS